MAKFKRQDAHRIMAHVESIQAIIAGYETQTEPFDEIDRVESFVQDIRDWIG